jgi:hypothetical protein
MIWRTSLAGCIQGGAFVTWREHVRHPLSSDPCTIWYCTSLRMALLSVLSLHVYFEVYLTTFWALQTVCLRVSICGRLLDSKMGTRGMSWPCLMWICWTHEQNDAQPEDSRWPTFEPGTSSKESSAAVLSATFLFWGIAWWVESEFDPVNLGVLNSNVSCSV